MDISEVLVGFREIFIATKFRVGKEGHIEDIAIRQDSRNKDIIRLMITAP